MTYTCPVCFYPRLLKPPADEYICPCCGTEFGYDDYAASHEELRRRWVECGARWFSQNTAPPQGWNPLMQMAEAASGPFVWRVLVSLGGQMPAELERMISALTQVQTRPSPTNILGEFPSQGLTAQAAQRVA